VGGRRLIDKVMVAGDTIVSGGRHRDRARIAARYRDVIKRLTSQI